MPSDHLDDERRPPAWAEPRRRLSIGATAAFAGQVSTIASGVVTSIFVARMFGPRGTGTYALLGNLFAAVILLAALGLPTGITYLVSRRAWSPRAAFHQSTAAALPMGLIGAAVGLGVFAITDNSIFDGVDLLVAITVMAAVPLGLVWGFCGSIAIAGDHYGRFAWFLISRAALNAAAVVGLGIPFGLTGAIVGFALAQMLGAGIAIVSLLRLTRLEPERSTLRPGDPRPASPLRSAFSFGRRAWSADVLQFLNYRLDLFMLAAFASRADVGRYSVAVSLTTLAWLAPNAIGQVLLPRTASLDSAAEAGELDREQMDRATARVIRHTVILQLPSGVAVVALLLVAVPFVYGQPFHETIALGLYLVPGVLILSIAKVISPVVAGRGFPEYSVYNVLISMPVTLGLYALLIPSLGATGAAVASSASYTLTTVIAVYFYRRATGASVRAAIIPTRADLLEYPRSASQFVSSGQRWLATRRNRTRQS